MPSHDIMWAILLAELTVKNTYDQNTSGVSTNKKRHIRQYSLWQMASGQCDLVGVLQSVYRGVEYQMSAMRF